MANRRYQKFGLRADKNLIDLGSSTEAVDNLLDGLATGTDVLGVPFQFSSKDILPLRSLIATDLNQILDQNTNLPKILTDMSGSMETISAGELSEDAQITGDVVVIQPQITLQDRINKFKSVLGDPPFISGGSGPSALYVTSSRLTPMTGSFSDLEFDLKPSTGRDVVVGNVYIIIDIGDLTDQQINDMSATPQPSGGWLTGNSFLCDATGDTAIGADTTARLLDASEPKADSAPVQSGIPNTELPANVLFTNMSSSLYQQTVTTSNDWGDEGTFEWSGPLSPRFSDESGLVQFTGFQTEGFNSTVETNGLLIIEEDVNDDGNFRYIAGSNTFDFQPVDETSDVSTNNDGVTEIKLQEIDFRKVGVGMTVDITGTDSNGDTITDSSVVESKEIIGDGTGGFYGRVLLQNDLDITESDIQFPYNSADEKIVFSYNPLNAVVQYGGLDFTIPAGDLRRKVRYTVWWPDNNPGLVKVFKEKDESATFGRLSFYKEQRDPLFASKRYSFPYFRDNRIYELSQKGETVVKVNKLFLNRYLNSTLPIDDTIVKSENAFHNINASGTEITPITVQVKTDGSLTSTDEDFVDTEVGDWIITTRNDGAANRYYAHQIVERVGNFRAYHYNRRVFVNPSYITATSIPVDTDHDIFIIKNQGLVGLYQYNGGTGSHILYELDMDDGNPLTPPPPGYWKPYEVRTGDLIHKVDFPVSSGNFLTREYAKKVETYSHGESPSASTAIITMSDNPADSSGAISSTQGIAAVYASRGLIDRTTLQECTRVYGKEVVTNIDGTSPISATNKIELNNVTGIAGRLETLSNVAITSTDGDITFDAANIEDGDHITISGTFGGSGTITDYTDPTTYEVSQINSGVRPYVTGARLRKLNTNAVVTTTGTPSGVTYTVNKDGDYIYFDGKIPYNASSMIQVGEVDTVNKSITIVDGSNNTVTLLGTLGAGSTVVFTPSTAGPNSNGWDKQNKEYCIIPLNTAPPWEGTALGLRSPVGDTTNEPLSVQAKELRFVKLSFTTPSVNIEPYNETFAYRDKFLNIKYVEPT